MPSWSLSPYLPHALPGGPSALSGRDENGGWGEDRTGFEGLGDDIVSWLSGRQRYGEGDVRVKLSGEPTLAVIPTLEPVPSHTLSGTVGR